MSKHTPGPWKHAKSFLVTTADGLVVARTEPVQTETYRAPRNDEIHAAAANACLIAAAPELLEALRQVARVCPASPPCGSVFRGELVPPCERCAIARAAIAKAEGGRHD